MNYRHFNVVKGTGLKDKKEHWKAFMLEVGFPEEFIQYEIPLEGERDGKPRRLRAWSWGTYTNTVGLVTVYCSWTEGAGLETWQLCWHWHAETEKFVGQPHWIKVR